MSDECQKTVMDKKQDSLEIERTMLVKAIKGVSKFSIKSDGTKKKKNKIDSTKYRQEGNKFFKSYEFHDADVHAHIFKLYTQSVALAPNDSEELSVAYGNRSALLFHFKKYEECLKDCDLALSVCKSDELKVKFLCRKVECLSNLKDSLTEKTRDETLHMLDQMHLDTSTKKKYFETLKKIEVKEIGGDASNDQNATVKLTNFTRQKQAPCASEAVAIKHDQEWGRHIVATRSIDPGEILAIEKSYYAVVYPDDMWFYCQNCVKVTWSSIPCEHCIYGIYCSKECRQEAWEKFHKFECEVYPYIWDLDENLKSNTGAIRLLLFAINELGSFSELRKEISNVESEQDPLKKGFSKDGVFHSDKFRSVFSLKNVRDLWDSKDSDDVALYAVAPLYYLATQTTLFGNMLPKNVNPLQLLLLEDALLFGALITRLYFMEQCSFLPFSVYRRDLEVGFLGFVVAPFCSLLNHSCIPNTVLVKSENNEMIAYAIRPIHEGEQLFIAYLNNNFIVIPKQERQKTLAAVHYFECKCMACLDEWTYETMPIAQDMILSNPKLALEIGNVACTFTQVSDRKLLTTISTYKPDVVKELTTVLKLYAEVLTPHCKDYHHFLNHLLRLFNRSFGSWFNIPHHC